MSKPVGEKDFPRAGAPAPHATMQAWLCRGYGGPENLACLTLPRPVPRPDDVLVELHATTVSSADVRIRTLKMPRGFGLIARVVFGFTRPRQPILGSEFSGVVIAVGKAVTAYQPGAAVVGFSGVGLRCQATHRTLRHDRALAPKPGNLSFEEAAALGFGGTTALHFLRRAGLRAGEKLLVIGASGAVGSAFVQLARHQGAHVTTVTSTRNLALMQNLGAERVLDYTTQEFTALGETYDVIADTLGTSSFARCLPVLNEHGRYLALTADLPGLFTRPFGTKRSLAGPAPERREDVRELCRLAEAGVFRPLVDRVYRFDQLPEAHAYAETGRKRGSVVVTCLPADRAQGQHR